MAFGTETISKVHKIFGPGNQYVTCAKQLVNKEGTAIDMPAGPSELAVLADVTNNMTSATQEWIDDSTNNLVVFPEGTRFISKDNDSLVILVEQKPQQRHVSYKQILQSPTGGFTFLNNNYFISLPFIQFIAKFVKQNNGYRFVELYMSCSKNPVESLDQTVNALVLPNIHHTNLVCIGSMANLPDN